MSAQIFSYVFFLWYSASSFKSPFSENTENTWCHNTWHKACSFRFHFIWKILIACILIVFVSDILQVVLKLPFSENTENTCCQNTWHIACWFRLHFTWYIATQMRSYIIEYSPTTTTLDVCLIASCIISITTSSSSGHSQHCQSFISLSVWHLTCSKPF